MVNDEIRKAIETGADIEIEYVKPDGTKSVRRLSDIRFSEEFGSTHIEAFCHLRGERRSFKISRIGRVTFLGPDDDARTGSGSSDPDQPYVFDGSKRIFALYGIDFN